MALINCPECGRTISDRAAACPACAYPLSDAQSSRVVLSNQPEIAPNELTPTPTTEFRTRPQPSVWVVILVVFGIFLVLLANWILGLALIVLPIAAYLSSFIEVTQHVVRVKRGFLSPTSEMQISKIETVEVRPLLGIGREVTVIGSGGTPLHLGALFNPDPLCAHLNGLLSRRRS